MGYSPVHMNQNLVCSIDTETTGLISGKHEIIQLCILPLAADYKPTREFRYFFLKIKPENLDEIDEGAMKINKSLIVDCINNGMDRWSAVDRLDEWFHKLGLPPKKKIVPLGCNYQYDKDFIREFLGGPVSYESYFRSDVRDVQAAALHHNDLADWNSERIPFPKVKLSYLCSQMGIPHPNAHDAMADAIATAEVYRRLMRYKGMFSSLDKAPTCVHSFAEDTGVCLHCKMLNSNYIEMIKKNIGLL